MKSDLRNCKVGDTIWIKAKVKEISKKGKYPIKTNAEFSYDFDGKYLDEDQFPSAFLQCPFVEVKEYEVGIGKNAIKKGVVINNVFYVESGWTEWKELEQKVTLEIPLSELENNPELKKYLKL